MKKSSQTTGNHQTNRKRFPLRLLRNYNRNGKGFPFRSVSLELLPLWPGVWTRPLGVLNTDLLGVFRELFSTDLGVDCLIALRSDSGCKRKVLQSTKTFWATKIIKARVSTSCSYPTTPCFQKYPSRQTLSLSPLHPPFLRSLLRQMYW